MSKSGFFVVDDYIGVALLTATACKEKKEPYLLITSNLYKAQKLFSLLKSLLPQSNIYLFPNDELIRADNISSYKEMAANRIFVLNEILKNRADIVIANISAVCRYLPDIETFKQNTTVLKQGREYRIQNLKKLLVQSGYLQVGKVTSTLQFALRGDILDVFSTNYNNPVRIEFFGDEIESIRYFDPATQLSLKNECINEIEILPANDFLFDSDSLKNAADIIFSQLEKDKLLVNPSDFDTLRNITESDVMDILQFNYSSRLYRYYSLISKKVNSLLEYTKDYITVLVNESAIKESFDILLNESTSYLAELVESGRMISHLSMFYRYEDLPFIRKNLIHTKLFQNEQNDVIFDVKNVPYCANKDSDILTIIHSYTVKGFKINISLSNQSQLNLLIELFTSNNLPYELVNELNLPKSKNVGLTIFSLNQGFVLENENVVYLTSKELFNEKPKTSYYDNRFKEATILNSYEDLNPGDYIVHEHQGIGQFVELQTLLVDGKHQDYLKLAYAGGEILYVPLDQFHLIRKYVGKEGIRPKLTRLHSKDWEKTKEKIKQRIHDLAERLFNLYVERSKIKGFAFPQDDEFQKNFENQFQHELTKDQKDAVEAIKRDMESTKPMDRLLCGDVGFGKTEVAFEAAFKAINSGKQVAILCPTTLLARQHYEVALKRFASFDVKIAIFSRLIPESRQKKYMEEVANGSIHLIIGTHRLLSKKIIYKDLGLLIVDEEQRFGVEQKEQLKELKTNIDVLTLSATPIPRTLQISLLGVRSLSQINTPPCERMPIQTYVTPYNSNQIIELIQRELGREGQVFYLHNNVDTIYTKAAILKKSLPDVSIGVVHGQLEKSEIEDVMLKFYNGDIQVLVCTSIVENGIDIPNANMVIVEESDHYGLAQLYQIKGRVGRGDRIAYAYLTYNGNKVLNEDAQRRLKALQDFSSLGSGYKIAQRDLMIRGAGDILGPEQAGFIDSIGLDMYIKLLNEAVQQKINNTTEQTDIEYAPNLSIKIDAYIPEQFASNSEKLELYQEILAASTTDSLLSIKNKVRDLYGTLPNEVELLFVKRAIQVLIGELETSDIKELPKYVEISLGDRFINIRGIGNIIFEAMIPYLSKIKISYVNHKFKIMVNKNDNWLFDILEILKALKNILDNNEIKERV